MAKKNKKEYEYLYISKHSIIPFNL